MKITFLGAGSVNFTRSVYKDILTFPALREAEICLMDIDQGRLSAILACCERIREVMGAHTRFLPPPTARRHCEGRTR